jgi:PAS domain-containing protein
MIRRGCNIGFRVFCRYLPYMVLFLLLLSLSIQSYSSGNCETNLAILSLNSVAVLSKSFIHLILTLLGPLVVISTVIIFFSIKLKKVNRDLRERNKQIIDINIDLQRTNNELVIQKELITKEHYESDKFYGMLIQSANDGISFYDRDWNLKYANSAFYSMIGDRKSVV